MTTLYALLHPVIVFMQPVITYWRDPVTRELIAMERARKKGIARRLSRLNWALHEADEASILRYQEETKHYLEVIGASSALPTQLQQTPTVVEAMPPEKLIPPPVNPTYIISSSTLSEAHAYLTQHLPEADQEPEWMLAVTGIKHNDIRTLEQLIEIKLATQSAIRASFDMEEFTRVAITLDNHGQKLHAIFHSHRFAGPPQPSEVDWRLQERLDEGRYPAIQAVFSEDGYVRFFANRPFAVQVYGKGVELVDQKMALYRILHFGTLPNPRVATQSRRSNGVRPVSAHPRS